VTGLLDKMPKRMHGRLSLRENRMESKQMLVIENTRVTRA
jgi:hypothetical protein